MQLIYHSVGEAGKTSPFDLALQQTAFKAPILRLASPYIGLSFLKRTTSAASDWRLLSDIEAWLHSINRKQRARCWEFIAENLDRIRHVAGLHAKVAIGNNRLFLGSANFTEKGMLGRAELSLLIDEEAQVEEAIAWFDALWSTACSPILDEGDALVSALNSLEWTLPKVHVRLTNTAPQIASVLAEYPRPEGFDLAGTMARAVIEEAITLSSLEEAYREVSDAWFSMRRSFTFVEFLQEVQKRIPNTTAREIWPLLTKETVNHWLGGLDPGGYDRYYYSQGSFLTFNSKNHQLQDTPPDAVLNLLLAAIPILTGSESLPLEEDWKLVGIREHQILPILELLLDTGFLIEHDIPGEIESYSIEHEFEWPHRWDKFTRSKAQYSKQQLSAQVSYKEDREETSTRPTAREQRTVIWKHLETKKQTLIPTPTLFGKRQTDSIPKEITRRAEREKTSIQELYVQQDNIVSALIDVLAEQVKPIKSITRKDINRELAAHRILSSLWVDITTPGLMLLNQDGGLVFNKKWDGTMRLGNFPQALQSWRTAIQSM